MSTTDALEQPGIQPGAQQGAQPAQKRRLANAIWAPFVQFKLLMYMLGSTAVVAVLLGVFLYYAFSDLIGTVTVESEARSYYAEMIDIQLVYLFRYCGALFVLYVLLLAAVCVMYTHRMIGPLRPFNRHIDKLLDGDYSSRVVLRKGDLEIFTDYADKLNQLAVNLEHQKKRQND